MNTLKDNFQYYLDNQSELLKKYDGRYLVIKDQEVVGDYSNERDAYFESKEKYGLGNFIIQYCSPGDMAYKQIFHSRVSFRGI